MVAAVVNSSATMLSAGIVRNIKIVADTLANENQCIRAVVNFPTKILATINDGLNCNWLNKGLD